MNDKIMGGAFLLARQIFDSKIWQDKPSTWKIIWIYIVGNVNHKDNGKFKRGEGFFNFSRELSTKNIGCDITSDMIKKFLQFARSSSMVSTKRSTRGTIIKVLNYNKYQTLSNYESTTSSTNKARKKHERSTTINKNDKNDKNEKNIIISELSSQVKQVMDIFYKTNPTLNWGNKTIRKACEDLINLMGIDKTLEVSAFAISVQGKPYYPVITTPYQLWIKLSDLKASYQRKKTGGAIDLDDIKL